MFRIKELSTSVDISTSSKQKECLFTAVILLSVSEAIELTASSIQKKLKKKNLSMFHFKVKASQK